MARSDKIIRSAPFAERFRRACDESPHCPDKHLGRYEWVKGEYKRQTKKVITSETVRKWHEGEAQARRDKIPDLAAILGVDPGWLEMGLGTPRGREVRVNSENKPIARIRSFSVSTIPVAIRPGLTVEICNLPSDLTPVEAKRIANVMLAYAVE